LPAALGYLPGAHAQAGSPAAQADDPTLSTIVVNANADASAEGLKPPYAGGQVARGGRVGILGSQDAQDTPFNITNYTQDLIQNQQAASVADVLQNDPSVRVARGFGNFQQVYMVRGFPVYSDDMGYNGLYGLLPRQYLAAELIERVEVFRGANTFLNGAAPGGSGVGGAINIVPKRASSADLNQVTVGVESGPQGLAAVDLSRRFGPDRSTGIRLNAVRRDGDTAIDDESRELSVLAVGIDYRQARLRLSADLGYQDHRLSGTRPSVTPLVIPSAPDASSNYGQPWTFSNERDTFGTLRGEFDLTEQVTAWIAAGSRNGKESNDLSGLTVLDVAGTTAGTRFVGSREDSVATGEIGVRGRFATGGVGHVVSGAVSAYQLRSRNAYGFSDFTGFPGNLFAPATVAAPAADFFTGGELGSPLITSRTKVSSLAIADTMSFAQDRVLLTLGARHQNIQDYAYDYDTGIQTSGYDKSRLTPVAGIVYKARDNLSLYANYIEGLTKGPTAPNNGSTVNISNPGEVFDPYNAKQTEVGVKYDAGRIGGGVAVFQTAQPSGGIYNGRFSIDGEQRNRGVEFSVYGEATRGVRVLGGLTLLNTELRNTGLAATEGRRAIGVPASQFNLGAEWDVPSLQGLTLTGRVVHTSSQYADASNLLEVPAWTRLDIGARYLASFGDQGVTLRAAVHNLTDRSYWASAGGFPGSGYLVQGDPRTVMLSASIDF
jgi:iron complex outermembrane receptor protein